MSSARAAALTRARARARAITLTPTTTGKDLGSGNFAVVKLATKTSANKQAEM